MLCPTASVWANIKCFNNAWISYPLPSFQKEDHLDFVMSAMSLKNVPKQMFPDVWLYCLKVVKAVKAVIQ